MWRPASVLAVGSALATVAGAALVVIAARSDIPPAFCRPEHFDGELSLDRSRYPQGEPGSYVVTFTNTSGEACRLASAELRVRVVGADGETVSYLQSRVSDSLRWQQVGAGEQLTTDGGWPTDPCSGPCHPPAGEHTLVVSWEPFGEVSVALQVDSAG